MARKTLIHKHTNLVVTNGDVISPKLPSSGVLEKGEIAVNYKDGYETLSIENDLGEVIPFASLEQVISYVDNSLPDLELSSNYSTSDLENEDLQLAEGDSYEEAFSKLEKAILDDEEIVATSLVELNDRINDCTSLIPETVLSEQYAPSADSNEDLFLEAGDTYEEAFSKLEKSINDNEQITSAALTELDSRIPTKTSDLNNDSNFTTLSEVTLTIVNSAPGTLDTLNELAAALGDDPNFATTIATQIGNKADKSSMTAGTYKSITVNNQGIVTGGTNPTTLAGYGITDAVTLNTEQTITGQKTLGLYGDERHTYNVCNFYLRTTFKHVVLYTNLPYSSGSFMPVITLKGFLYSTTDLESKITFYIYNNEFYTPKVLHLGAASPIVYLFTYSDNGTERVAVGLEGNFYYLGFQADIHFPALGEAYKPKSLWTFNTDNITYDSTTTEENRIIPSIGVNHCAKCGVNSLGTTTTGNIAKIGSSTDNAVPRFDGTASAIQNSGVIIDDSNNLTANSFKKTGGTSSQFLKADGSIDSNTYLTSHLLLKTINNESLIGSGNITIQGGSGGDVNVIETVKVNGTALTPDANKAVNIDLSSYDKAPLIIEINTTDTTVPSGTYTNIGNALANGREVYIKINGDDLVIYLKLCGDLSRGRSKCYEFLGSTVMANIWNDNTLSIEFDIYAASDHNHGDIDNDGTLNHSQAISIANGDRIVITDASNNDKIQKTSTTFDGSTTTTALTPKGTWEPFLKTAPVQSVNGQTGAVTLALGQTNVIETVKVNGTTLTPDSNKAVDITVPAAVTESTVSGWGFTKNSGTVTGVKMNGTTNNPTSGVVDLGTVLTSFTETDPTVPSHVKLITTTDISNWNGKQAAIADLSDIRSGAALGATALLSYTETDPTVPSWAKATNKPTYTAAEVGALPDTYTPPVTSVNGQTGAVSLTIPAAVTESTVSGWGFTKNTGTVTGVKINGTTKNPTSGVVDLGSVLTSETSLSKGTTSGSGNAVTDISVSGHTITLTKGSTFLTSHLNIKTVNGNSLVGTGNISIDTLPTVTASDNGKVLQVVNGAWSLVTPVAIYSGTATPSNSTGNNGDLYLQTS